MALDFNSYIKTDQQPQTNQFLTGDPSTDNSAQTDWMDAVKNNKYAGDFNPTGARPENTNQAPPSGTMLGSIASGTFMPSGYDQNKWNDPNKHDPKYDVGRILSQYQPGTAGLDQAYDQQLKAQGYTRVGKDAIFRPDVGTIDVGRAFGTGDNSQMGWQWLPQEQQGMMQNQQQQQPNQLLQWIMSLFGNQNQNQNSTGGYAQPIMRMQPYPVNNTNPVGETNYLNGNI